MARQKQAKANVTNADKTTTNDTNTGEIPANDTEAIEISDVEEDMQVDSEITGIDTVADSLTTLPR
jgi:hypothetical protein